MTNDDDVAFFRVEACDLVEALESGLLALERSADVQTIHAVFRAIHTIKGGAGLVGLDRLAYFAHEVEHVLQFVRDGALAPTADVVAALLTATDVVRRYVDGEDPPAAITQPVHDAIRDLLARRDLKPAKQLELVGRSQHPED